MVSPEFRATISEKNLLRARIMLKDSFIVDPTFSQLDEMLAYAKSNLSNLLVTYDGDYLETDSAKWNQDVMNEELVQLVTNFSEVRINHLKQVVAKVMYLEAEKIKAKRATESKNKSNSPYASTNSVSRASSNFRGASSTTKETERREALKTLSSEARKINKTLFEVESNRVWKSSNVNDMEQAARKILDAVQIYRNNK